LPFRLGNNHRNRFASVAYPIHGKQRLIFECRTVEGVAIREILGGKHRQHAWCSQCRPGVETLHLCMRQRTAPDLGMDHATDHQISGVAGASSYLLSSV
jgi:hypothetical protein